MFKVINHFCDKHITPGKQYTSIGVRKDTIEYKFNDKLIKNIIKEYDLKNEINYDTSIYQIDFNNFKFRIRKQYFSISMQICEDV